MNAYQTAVHEAGHAVIARVLGLTCRLVTIVPDEEKGTLGCAHVESPDDAWWRWIDLGKERDQFVAYRARMIVNLAGEEAEREMLGAISDGYDSDYESTTACAMEMSDVAFDPDQRMMRRLRRQTVRLVRKHCDKIERVAAALVEQRTLSGDEIDALVRQSP